MDFINLLSANAISNAIGDLIYKYLYAWVKTWSDNWEVVGAFSITTIMFTVFLKVLVSPLDIWQKAVMRKNAKKMEEMKPELEKITKQCGSNRELLAQKQREVYKKHKYSMFGSCLPLVITMVVFFIVFAGFNGAVSAHTEATYTALRREYTIVYEQTLRENDVVKVQQDGESFYYYKDGVKTTAAVTKADWYYLKGGVFTVIPQEESTALDATAKKAGQDAVVKLYDRDYKESFFWVKNIFAGDNWSSPIMSAGETNKSVSVNPEEYNDVMGGLIETYTGWNGYLILPILVLLLNVASIFINKPMMKQQQDATVAAPGQTEEQKKAQQSQSKMMQYIMPVMMFVFALFYSAAFTLYMFVNMLFSIALNLTYTLITKKKDDRERDQKLSTTYK